MFIKKSCDALTKFKHYTGQKYQLDVYKVLLLYLKIRQSLLQVGKIFIVNNGLEGTSQGFHTHNYNTSLYPCVQAVSH